MKKELKVIKETEILGKAIKMYGSIEYPLFLAKDVSEWIEHSNLTMMLKHVDSKEQLKISPKQSLGLLTTNNEYNFLTEDGLYEVCMSSRKPIAKEMKKEIKSYLKQIRITGGVVQSERESEFINNYFPSFAEETKLGMVTDLLKSNNEYKQRIAELEPDAKLAQDLMQAKGLLTLKQVSDNIEIGRTKLCSLLRQKKILSKQSGYNEPMGKYIKSQYFKTIVHEDIKEHISVVTLVTPKGLEFIYRLLKKNDMLSEFNTTPLLSKAEVTV